jgi:hypothetical protein
VLSRRSGKPDFELERTVDPCYDPAIWRTVPGLVLGDYGAVSLPGYSLDLLLQANRLGTTIRLGWRDADEGPIVLAWVH